MDQVKANPLTKERRRELIELVTGDLTRPAGTPTTLTNTWFNTLDKGEMLFVREVLAYAAGFMKTVPSGFAEGGLETDVHNPLT